MASAPMFPNFMSSTLGINFNLLKSEKNHGERTFFPHQDDFFLNLLCDNSNVSYREKKGDTLARKPPC
jgi:hypothetical protein